MEFGSEEEQMSKGKIPFSYSSSSSPSSSSSHQKTHLVPLAQIYENQQHHGMGSWLGTKYEPEQEDTSRLNGSGGTAAKLELMEVNEDSGAAVIEKKHMFDKVVTPSDVGKLNRLVIPKQHAEKYFPLDSSSNEKGLLLNFEDRTGKAWRFRYSYWNSSQSYVMTKGWSRFVKEKKLDAGDIVSFQRGVGDSGKDHLYIDWRRRLDAADHQSHNHQHQNLPSIGWSPLLTRPSGIPLTSNHHHQQQLQFSNTRGNHGYYNSNGGSCYGYNYYSGGSSSNHSNSSGTIVYMRPLQQVGMGMGMVQWQQGAVRGAVEPMVYESVPVVQGKAAAKRLRLFGVNMDCPITDSQECEKLSSPTPLQSMTLQQHPHLISSPNSYHSLQLRLFNGTPIQSPIPPPHFLHKEKSSSSMSLDLDI